MKPSVERQKDLTSCHLYTQLDLFAYKLTVCFSNFCIKKFKMLLVNKKAEFCFSVNFVIHQAIFSDCVKSIDFVLL